MTMILNGSTHIGLQPIEYKENSFNTNNEQKSNSFCLFDKINKENIDENILKNISVSKPGIFKFRHEILAIKHNPSVLDKDTALAKRFYAVVNPGKILDGHCASCAWNTHLHLTGGKLTEAISPSGDYFDFGNWFYSKFSHRFEENIIESEPGDTYEILKEQLMQKLEEVTSKGEAVLISVSEGSHWFNAYNDGDKIWLIDSQKGKGFNLNDLGDFSWDEKVDDMEAVSIIKVDEAVIKEYRDKFPGK